MMGRNTWAAVCLLAGALALAFGCDAGRQLGGPQQGVTDAQAELRRLKKANEELLATIADQQQQIDTLLSLGKERLEKLYRVQEIALGRYTGGVDLDGKAGHDGIKVYVEPLDQHGSVLKAAGQVIVELYDLAADPKENLIGKYQWSVDETAEHWSSGFVSYHYSFECPWQPAPPRHGEITVRVSFVEYLTGKTFTAQKHCKVNLPAAAAPAK